MQHGDLIVGEISGVRYYVSGLFRYGEVYCKVVNVSVCVLMQMVNHVRQQQVLKLYDYRVQCLFWKNHPVKSVRVMGIVVGVKFTWIKNEDHAVILLDDSSDSQILPCRMEVNYLRSFGINFASGFVGSRVSMTGEYNLEFSEFVVNHIEILSNDLSAELNFWTIRDKDLLTLSDWVVELPSLDSLCGDSLPSHAITETTYIDYLLGKNVRDELLITSPVYETDENVNVLEVNDSLRKINSNSCNQVIDLECDSYNALTNDPFIFSYAIQIRSTKALRREVLWILLNLKQFQISKLELYDTKDISTVLDNYATYQFQQQNVKHPVKYNDYKSLAFDDCLQQLIELNIVQYTDSKEMHLNLKVIQDFKSYVKKRMSILVKLRNLLGYIQFDEIRAVTSKSISTRVILHLFKEVLKILMQHGMNEIINHWYIDTKNEKGFIIHLQYS